MLLCLIRFASLISCCFLCVQRTVVVSLGVGSVFHGSGTVYGGRVLEREQQALRFSQSGCLTRLEGLFYSERHG